METFAGLVFGVPTGVTLYYAIEMAYQFVLLLLSVTLSEITSAFPIPDALVQELLHGLDNGPLIDVVLAGLATASLFRLTGGAIRRGYRVFSWVQLPLALSAAMGLFYLTFREHRPLFPFYGQ